MIGRVAGATNYPARHGVATISASIYHIGMNTYDVRSDTITKPTMEMRKAMYEAEVGDDVYGDDPSVNRLQELAAEVTGKEASLFVSSGSMGNLIPMFLLCGRGNEVIAHEYAHAFHYEMASVAALAGAMPVRAKGERGVLRPEAIEPLLRPPIYYLPKTRLVEVENTHNLAGGTCYREAELAALRSFCDSHDLSMHMDGARMFNASVATGMAPEKIASYADTITFCLSKGLGAPVGSMLCGTKPVIEEARRVRKLLGGGMRQAGVLAAAGIYALKHNVERLAEDHIHAGMLATALAETTWAEVDPATIETNIVYFQTPTRPAAQVSEMLKKAGVLCNPTAPNTIRMVTSLEVTREDVDSVCAIIASLSM